MFNRASELFDRQLRIFTNHDNMALLVDKHRPRSLDDLTYHHDLSERLRSLVRHQLSSHESPS
jgi:hypothetical protein